MPKKSSLRKEGRHSGNESFAINRKSHVSISDAPKVAGTARFMSIMRHFSETHTRKCSVSTHAHKPVVQSKITKPTGSSYEGSWNVLGDMSGHGIYTFPNGVVYEGGFLDGEFNGAGELRYRSGVSVKGKFKNGQITKNKIIFNDGLEYNDQNWKYCKYPDIRFTIEHEEGLQPAGRSHLTADHPTRKIPSGYYDTGYGFYNPFTKTVYKYNNILDFAKSPDKKECISIESTCRRSPDVPIGPCKFFYEKWLTPTLKREPPPPSSVHAKTYARKRDCTRSFNSLFGRSTSRIRENNRRSIRSCGGIPELYNSPYSPSGRFKARSYSDQLLADASNASRNDKIVLDSIHSLLSRSDSSLWRKTRKSLSKDVNKSVQKSLVGSLKGTMPTNKQLINW